MNKKDLIIITGCDSGIGESLATLLFQNGYNLAITYLEKNPLPKNEKIFAFKMLETPHLQGEGGFR